MKTFYVRLLLIGLFLHSISANAAHRIGVRETAIGGEFFDRVTGLTFTPRGNNYIRVVPGTEEHSLFDAYDATAAENSLSSMQASGYNTVRIFINDHKVGASVGLNTMYLQNVVDFLKRAHNHSIYTIITLPYIPISGGYAPSVYDTTRFELWNHFFLEPGFVAGKQRYVKDFINGIYALGAPLESVLAYAIENEQYYKSTNKPLSLSSGLVTTANGLTYDMASFIDRQQMMDANLVYYINSVRAAIRSVDANALVTIGFFSPKYTVILPHTDSLVRPYWAIHDPEAGGSSADFIDFHFYPNFPGGTLQDHIDAIHPPSKRKPFLMGEFGAANAALSSYGYSDITTAAYALRDWQIASCTTSIRFTGWLAWTWDTYEQPTFWNLVDSRGAINGVLAPIVRADPCR